jgi:hypothetical protein
VAAPALPLAEPREEVTHQVINTVPSLSAIARAKSNAARIFGLVPMTIDPHENVSPSIATPENSDRRGGKKAQGNCCTRGRR